MAFTASHAIIALPFRHSRRFVFSALIVGSMAPDFEYYSPLNRWRILFWLLAIAGACALFHALAAQPVIADIQALRIFGGQVALAGFACLYSEALLFAVWQRRRSPCRSN